MAKIHIAINVTIDYQKRLVSEQRQGRGNAAGGFQRAGWFGRILNVQAPLRTIAQRLLNQRTEMGVVDDNFPEPRRRQSFQVPDYERLAAGQQQWLGRVVGQRPHAFAATGGEDEGFHDAFNAGSRSVRCCLPVCRAG